MKTLDYTLAVGEPASFIAADRAGWGTYSVLAFLVRFPGAGPLVSLSSGRLRRRMEPELAVLLTELVEKIGLLRRDMQHKGDLETYQARVARIEQKFTALVDAIAEGDPDLAKSLRTAWRLPARSLAFRNTEHRKKE